MPLIRLRKFPSIPSCSVFLSWNSVDFFKMPFLHLLRCSCDFLLFTQIFNKFVLLITMISTWSRKIISSVYRLIGSQCSLTSSSVHGIPQVRILEWIAIPFSGGSSPPRDQTQVSCIAGKFFAVWSTREAPILNYNNERENQFDNSPIAKN